LPALLRFVKIAYGDFGNPEYIICKNTWNTSKRCMKEKVYPTTRDAPEFIPGVEWLGMKAIGVLVHP